MTLKTRVASPGHVTWMGYDSHIRCSCWLDWETSYDHVTPLDRAFDCLDCGIDTSPSAGIGEYYAVRNELWWDYMPEFHGMLCIGCLETRMGRQLQASDFQDVPINKGCFPMSDRFKSRVSKASSKR